MTLLAPEQLTERPAVDSQALKLQRRHTRRLKLFEPALVKMATIRSFLMLDPRNMARNPVMFLVEAGWVLTTMVTVESIVSGASVGLIVYQAALAVLLLLTVLFANFAEALAEARGKAQAQSLRATRQDTMAARLDSTGETNEVSSTELKPGDRVVVEAGQIIPADGEIVEGVASVDESAITGESAPVIREAGGDRSGVTGGTRVLSDRIVVEVTAGAGESFLDRMIALVEGASRQKTPNEIALTIILAAFSIIFLIVTATLYPMARYFDISLDIPTLIALLVCLIPTTIGALLAAIGIAGMDRALAANLIAKSGKAVEVAGDVDTLLLDKTGTITLGNRRATLFVPMQGTLDRDLARMAALASLADTTPEGKSVVELARQEVRARAASRGRQPVHRVHRPDPDERHRHSRRQQDPQGRAQHDRARRGGVGGDDPRGLPGNRRFDRVEGGHAACRDERQPDRRADQAGRHLEARHPRTVRQVEADGPSRGDGHGRQPPDGKGDRRRGGRRRLHRPGHARGQAGLHPQRAGRRQAGRHDG